MIIRVGALALVLAATARGDVALPAAGVERIGAFGPSVGGLRCRLVASGDRLSVELVNDSDSVVRLWNEWPMDRETAQVRIVLSDSLRQVGDAPLAQNGMDSIAPHAHRHYPAQIWALWPLHGEDWPPQRLTAHLTATVPDGFSRQSWTGRLACGELPPHRR